MRGSDLFHRLASREPFTGLHPSVAQFFRDYLSREKTVRFGDRFVINTHFPPYPSSAFDSLAEHFGALGDPHNRKLYSVTLGVTNRCHYHCWHCSNAGRAESDMPLADIQKIACELSDMGAVMITLSGGEPLLRDDLEDIAGLFDDRFCLMLNTTGSGLTARRARSLKKKGLFAVGISLDSMDPDAHDRMRGKPGAFQTALRALRIASDAGLYPYIVAVATRDLIEPGRFMEFLEFAGSSLAREVHLLEPCATGRLKGRDDITLNPAERRRIERYQAQVALRQDLPVLSTFTYLESPKAFGCGAGLTYLYIDGSGEVCPCNLVPLSFGNAARESLRAILDRMGEFFTRPRTSCAGHILSKHIAPGPMPVCREASEQICREHLPPDPSVPRFFSVKRRAASIVGNRELQKAYDSIHRDYDVYWLSAAGGPIRKLVRTVTALRPPPRSVFEAGCGTGFATSLLAGQLNPDCRIFAADLSRGMIRVAKERTASAGHRNVHYYRGDALTLMARRAPFDLIFSSWALGYIPMNRFFKVARASLNRPGRIAFVVHRQNSPGKELRIFYKLVGENPSVLKKRVHFDFPRDKAHVEWLLRENSFVPERITGGRIVFVCSSPEDVLTHLLRSGAGTAFYDALDPDSRQYMEERFKDELARRVRNGLYNVVHDYIMCIARTNNQSEAERS
jgi:MoaA/NifB/PqqE/SkfB family radical SAM enzyme/SAM-dependent methyltransferase